MVIGRAGHQATLLLNGKVLVSGGHNTETATELYDPASGTWSLTGNLAAPRLFGHTSTLLSNGNVLVVGGFNEPRVFFTQQLGAELYNPSTGSWTNDAGFVGARGDHTATLLQDGRVLVAGGQTYTTHVGNPTLKDALVYDPAAGNWSATSSMAGLRARHTATLLPNGKVLVAGGYSSQDGGVRPTAELYDPATGTWTATGSLAHARSDHTATLLHSGKVLVTGGNNNQAALESAELYDPSTGTWTPTGSLAAARGYHRATLLASNRVLVTGGSNSVNSNGALASAELYDPAAGNWSSTGSMGEARFRHTATLLSDDRVLIAGGGKNDNRSAEIYTEPPVPPRLLNISTRLRIQTGDNAMIGGFIITGTEPKTVIVRGVGPSLGMPGALQDPVIEVHGSSGELLATNDNWQDATTKQQIMDSGLAPANDSESALWGVINPGAYTVVVKGKDDATGIGLFEVYDLDQSADAILANISTRGLAKTGDDIMIGGIIVGGGSETAATKVLIRAIGPSLPVANALGDPTLELRDASGTLIASNDNWKVRADGSSQQAEIEATAIPPSHDLESALVQTLTPNHYTAILRGKDNTIGVGLVEVYNLR